MKIKSITYILFFILVIFSCSKMNDMHQEYLDSGEIIYAAQLDSVSAASGYNRIELEMLALSQRIEKVRIYWNESTDSLDVMVNNEIGTFYQIVPDLPEGEYIFQLVSFDKYGNKSLKYEISSQSFGDIYLAGLVNRTIDQIDYVGDILVIEWKMIANALGTSFFYENSEGDTTSVFIQPAEYTTTISDFKSDGNYWYSSLYKPTENALDTFATEVTRGVIPHFVKYVECDKSLFTAMALPNDLGRLGWDDNERMERLWDGSVGPQGYPWIFHSDGSALPGVITFDMGKVYNNLARIEETGRDCCGNPIVFEVWGIDDISNAVTELRANDPGWSAESVEKGWRLLKEVVRTDDGKAPYKVDLNDDLPPVRYIRLRFKECFEGSSSVNLSEVTFWYKE